MKKTIQYSLTFLGEMEIDTDLILTDKIIKDLIAEAFDCGMPSFYDANDVEYEIRECE